MTAFRKLTAHPFLIAFRNKWGLWVLLDVDSYTTGSFRITIDDMRESLMGLLLNDCFIVVPEGTGITFELARLGDRIEVTEGGWKEAARVDDVYVHRGDGTRIDEPIPWWQHVLATVMDDDRSKVTDELVTQQFVALAESSTWMHWVFAAMAGWMTPEGEDVNWKGILERIKDYPAAEEIADKLLSAGFVSHVFHPVPYSVPRNFRSFDPRSER